MKQRRNTIILIIAFVLVIILVAGMILTSALLAQKNYPQWDLTSNSTKVNYYTDDTEYSFKCISDFSSALKNYINKNAISFLGLDKKVDLIVERVVTAMQEAGIPANKLETLAQVINNNRLPSLFNSIEIPFSTIDEFSIWSDNAILSITDETLFTIIGNFVHSLLKVTTLSEDELAQFLYSYLSLYGPDKYRSILRLYGKDKFIGFFSDTFFAVRILSQTHDNIGITFGSTALKSSLYQLGKVYIDILSIGDDNSFESLFGFPDEFTSEKSQFSSEIQEKYLQIKGLLANTVRFFANIFTIIDEDDINAYLQLEKFNKENHRIISILSEKKESNTITSDEEGELNALLDKKMRLQAFVAQKMSKKVITVITENSDISYIDQILAYKNKLKIMRDIIFMLSDISSSSIEMYSDFIERIEQYSSNMISSLEYFADTDYSYSEIHSMTDTEEIALQAENFTCGSKLLELSISSAFNILLTYKVNDWGLLENE